MGFLSLSLSLNYTLHRDHVLKYAGQLPCGKGDSYIFGGCRKLKKLEFDVTQEQSWLDLLPNTATTRI